MNIKTQYFLVGFFIILGTVLIEKAVYALDGLQEPEPIYEERYQYQYSSDFFMSAGSAIKFNDNLHLKIGIVIKNESLMSMKEIINVIFSVSPFNRYRDFFVFIDRNQVDRGARDRDVYIEAYNAYGRQIPGGFDIGNSSVRAGLIVLRVDDHEFAKTGTLGYSKNKLAVAQKITILHELGHVLGNLGEEYSINETESHTDTKHLLEMIGVSYEHGKYQVWHTEHANVDYRNRKIIKWQPLIEQGIIPDKRLPRVQIEKGIDVGRFVIPTDRCIMNRIIDVDMSYCPVCQLQLIESICRLTGAIPPWEQDK